MSEPHQSIALIGMGCRFPGGVNSPSDFWQLLRDGRDAVTTVPPDRWDVDAYWSADREAPAKTVSRCGGFVDNVDCFDAAFFGISPREAACMDPQQRWLLEIAYEALEDAGIPLDDVRGSRTGVFIGMSTSDYAQMQAQGRGIPDPHTMSGGALCIAANRISYAFDLRGPSLAVDTACSSSLTALHLACQSLWQGECDLALAGGVNALLAPAATIGFSRAGMLSPTGRCHVFSAAADGYVRSEGAGLVVLQPRHAVAAGVRPYALVRATAVNEDGHTSSLPVPSQSAQETLLNQALSEAGISPDRITYIEAHATGTPVGDPVEAAALGAVVTGHLPPGRSCWVGSVKSNLGHLEPAAGIAGLCKAALVLRHRTLVPNLHFDEPNPAIDFEALQLAVPVRAMPLDATAETLVACVNSFGFGGGNACAVLEEAPIDQSVPAATEAATATGQELLLLPFSARSRPALEQCAARYSEFVASTSETPAAALCAAAARCRSHHPFRGVALGTSHDELASALNSRERGSRSPFLVLGRSRAVAEPTALFVFGGQGGHWHGMGRGLLEREETFLHWMRECDRLVQDEAGWSLLAELGREPQESRLDCTEVGQPVLMALQVALVHLWESWGICPAAVLGHSVGEVAAAYTAGILALPEAVHVVVQRSRLQQRLAGTGGMAALGLGETQAQALIETLGCDLDIAAVNSPGRVTVAGDAAGLQVLEEHAAATALPYHRLNVDCPFHSRLFEPLRQDLAEALAGLRPGGGKIPMVSSVTGAPVEEGELDAAYWWRNLREPVRFSQALAVTPAGEFCAALEIGPHSLLKSALQRCLRAWNRPRMSVLPSMRQDQDEATVLRNSLARLYALGFTPRWSAVLGGAVTPRDLELPRYPWQRERLWQEPAESRRRRLARPLHPLIWERIDTALPTWESRIDLHALAYLRDHQIGGRAILPAAACMEMALAAGHAWKGETPFVLEELTFLQAVNLELHTLHCFQCSIEPDTGNLSIERPGAGAGAEWEAVSRGTVTAAGKAPPDGEAFEIPQETFCRDPKRQEMAGSAFYAEVAQFGYAYGPSFQAVDRVWAVGEEALGRLVLPENVCAELPRYRLHPAALDACLHVFGALLMLHRQGSERILLLPVSCARLRSYRPCTGTLWVHVIERERAGAMVRGDLVVRSETGERVADLQGLEFRTLATSAERSLQTQFHQFIWREAERPTESSLPAPGDPRLQTGTWLLFLDEGRVGRRLAELFASQGHSSLLARRGALGDSADDRVHSLRADDAAAMAALTAAALREPLQGIVYLWGLDTPRESDGPAPGTPASCAADSALGLLHLIQALAASDSPGSVPRLWIGTAGPSQDGGPAALPAADAAALTGAGLWGLMRVAMNEYPDLACTALELDLGMGQQCADFIYDEIWCGTDETEIALRRGSRYARRLTRRPIEAVPYRLRNALDGDALTPFRLESTQPGLLDRLAWRTCERVPPGPGEAEVRVATAALNFRDVLKALDVYPGDAEDVAAFGDEAAGVISAVGPGVTDRRPGDAVVVLGQHCLAAHVTVPAAATFLKPEGMGFDEAAALPVVFLTAWHALVHSARLRAGEKVLIHAASGGVGLAAVRVAQRLGAEVFGTAGSEQKRDFLRGQGVVHVMDSRSLDFADEVLAATSGRGVDVVLNSLAGEFITKGLSVLAPGGRFLELGKRDIYRGMRISLSAFKNNLSYMAIDLAAMLRDQPDVAASQLNELLELLKRGELDALPCQTFPAGQVHEAFRHMSQAKHIGKVVLDLRQDEIPLLPPAGVGLPVHADGTYLISGGLSGFGLRTAEWLAQKGAGCLLLFSRRGEPAPESVDILARLRAGGTRVETAAVDVTSMSALGSLVEGIPGKLPPLRGVIHAAMVLDDAPLADVDAQRFRNVFRPKAEGAWNLHLATRDTPLDFFVLYSSVSAMLGNPRQANYAAANTFLDALAHHRRNLGLPGLSVNFGGITDAGYLARTPRAAEFLRRGLGMKLLGADEALAALDRAFPRDVAQVGIFDLDWQRARGFLSPVLQTSTLRELLARDESAEGHADPGMVREQVLADPDAASDLMLSYLRDVVAHTLGANRDTIEPDVPLSEMGLDSLMAVELKVRLDTDLGIRLEPGRFRQVPSLRALGTVTIRLVRDSAAVSAQD